MENNEIEVVKPKVKVTKLSNDMGAPHPNKIEKDFTFEGIEYSKPTVGMSYYLFNGAKAFSSSMVTEVLDNNTFKTLNSTYKIEYL